MYVRVLGQTDPRRGVPRVDLSLEKVNEHYCKCGEDQQMILRLCTILLVLFVSGTTSDSPAAKSEGQCGIVRA